MTLAYIDLYNLNIFMARLFFKKVTRDIESSDFDCGVHSINDYVKQSYYPMLIQDAYTYEISADGKTLGYYMILFRDIKMNRFPEEIAEYVSDFHGDTISAIHIKFIAISKQYQRHGIGTAVLRTIIKRVLNLSKDWPIRVITLDASINVADWYKKEKFVSFANTSGQEGITESLYFSCLNNPQALKQYQKV